MSKSATAADEHADSATLIDASALIALLGAEPAADQVREILSRGAAMTTLNLAEVVDRLKRLMRCWWRALHKTHASRAPTGRC
jgi:predicted nucleic acid-binding protein